MQKQETHSYCTSVTKTDDNGPQTSPNTISLLVQKNQPAKAKIGMTPSVTHSEDQEKSRQVSEARMTKKCFNQKCSHTQIFKKVKSRVQKNKYRFLCQNCYENYINLQFCEFCQQIYGTDIQDEDGSNWVGCDNCDRWNHITCEIAARGFDFKTLQNQDSRYCCLKCLNEENNTKLRQGLRARPESLEKEYLQHNRSKQVQPCLREYQKVQVNWQRQQFSQLELFLNNLARGQLIPNCHDFKLSLSDDLVKYDINRLKNNGTNSFSIKTKN